MQQADIKFQKFNRQYKKKLDEVIKENKLTDLFDQVDEALKRVKEDDACRNVRRSQASFHNKEIKKKNCRVDVNQ